MELKDFIKAAITDITDAVSELQNELTNGAIINPPLSRGDHHNTIYDTEGDGFRPIEQLSFDVAVTVGETSGVDGHAKAGISIFGAKLGATTSARTENASRISFSIPIVLPSPLIPIESPSQPEEEEF